MTASSRQFVVAFLATAVLMEVVNAVQPRAAAAPPFRLASCASSMEAQLRWKNVKALKKAGPMVME